MRVIFKRTLQETLRLVFLILMLAAGVIGGLVLGKNSTFYDIPSYDHYLNSCLIMQHMVAFFLVCGAAIMVIVSAVGSGLIAGEVHEGTFRILVSKPNSRMSILLGKVLGMLIGSLMLLIIGISSMLLTELLIGKYDKPIAETLLSYAPGYLLYGAIVLLFFSSLATLLSCIAKKKVIAFLPMLLVMILVLILPLVLRIIMMIRGGQSSIITYIDPNYHFGSIFKWCMDLCGGIQGTSEQLELPTILMNIYKQVSIDRDLSRTNLSGTITLDNTAVPVMLLLTVYGALTVINYLVSFLIIRRKDV